jgi:hypothetical protein
MENGASPALRAGLFPGAVFPAALRVPAATPPLGRPCANGPRGAGRVGRAETGSDRSGLRTVPALRGRRSRSASFVTQTPRLVFAGHRSGAGRQPFPTTRDSLAACLKRENPAPVFPLCCAFTPFPRSCHGKCGDIFCASPGIHNEANTFSTQPPIPGGAASSKKCWDEWKSRFHRLRRKNGAPGCRR